MFTITVLKAFHLKSLKIVAIEGEVKGVLKGSNILYDSMDREKKYIVKGAILVDGKDITPSRDRMDIQLQEGDFTTEELIGRTLIEEG